MVAPHIFYSYIKYVDIEFDPVKDATNIVKHGVSLAEFDGFEAVTAVLVDDRFDYGEVRFGRSAGSAAKLIRLPIPNRDGHSADQLSPRPRQGDAPL